MNGFVKLLTCLPAILAAACIPAITAAQGNARFQEHQVGREGASTVFSYFNTTPESPDGKTIAYIRCEQEPAPGKTRVPAALWICDRDISHHRKVAQIKSISVHDGAETQWVDNNRIALFDDLKLRVVAIHSGKDLLRKERVASEIGHETYKGKLLYSICEGKVPGEPGIYELDCNTQEVRTVLHLKDLGALPLPAFLKKDSLYPLLQWQLSHLQYSPDGEKICFRIELGPKDDEILLGVCNADGTDIKVWIKPLHFLWYDSHSIIGHLSNEPDGKKPEPYDRRFSLTRWDLNGKVIGQMLAPRGNHLALSPSREYVASESFYQTNPVVLTLYTIRPGKQAREVCRFDPQRVTWKEKFHVNPSFSRDGKRLYYSRPLDATHNGTFFIEIL
ncbi:WD40-like Beta Propeller Repeat [Niabella drilacis]|uniref:WD40-like Beta Propeller Repeat n=2 Tax=Niabella drilacis (strain DSM 25811 / CCM 8410 / CCUG 62505 / LMG 26954 / E90) TaxID=1285928 RepID=A0A1G6RH57_NIADE|nr:WD40-like Beta Propeller Repeat [Niabella drilacis]